MEEAGLGKQRQVGKVQNDDRVDWSAAAYSLFPGNVAYVWHGGIHSGTVARALESAGFEIRAQIIWSKQHFALSRGPYHYQHEPCYYCVRKGPTLAVARRSNSVHRVGCGEPQPFGSKNPEDTATGHSTQKPVELMRRPILNHTEPGDVIYDPFLGSSTALMAAELTGRICYGIEIDPKYIDLGAPLATVYWASRHARRRRPLFRRNRGGAADELSASAHLIEHNPHAANDEYENSIDSSSSIKEK